jgi:hypothetical protein
VIAPNPGQQAVLSCLSGGAVRMQKLWFGLLGLRRETADAPLGRRLRRGDLEQQPSGLERSWMVSRNENEVLVKLAIEFRM